MVSIDLRSVEGDGRAVVALRGELDVTDAAVAGAALTGIVACHPDVVIDLAGLAFLDCCGLRALAGAREQARQAGGDLQLAAPQGLVLRVLSLAGPAGAFSIRAGQEVSR
ncbi:MAG TPA: STAS domain-containing protein [Trebonia sp.]